MRDQKERSSLGEILAASSNFPYQITKRKKNKTWFAYWKYTKDGAWRPEKKTLRLNLSHEVPFS